MKHVLYDYRARVDRTHSGLGNMAAAAFLSTKARKALVISSVSGTGKTTAIDWAAKQNPYGDVRLDSITRSGLKGFEEELSGFRGNFTVNDMGAVDTIYGVKESAKVITLLCHEHALTKKNVSMDLAIVDYYGSALSTIQPASMPKLISGADWESVLQDKLVRYYHLTRPSKVANEPIEVDTKWGPELGTVNVPKPVLKDLVNLVNTEIQPWSDARAVQHWFDFTRAAAALAGRKAAIRADLEAAREILKPLKLEAYLVGRENIASKKFYLAVDHCILTELASYGELNHARTVKNYRISTRTLQRTIDVAGTWLIPGAKGQARHLPSQQALDVLQDAGYKVKVK